MSSERVGISTTTFANFNLSEGPKVVAARLQNNVYSPEIESTIQAIRMFGLPANEIVYRRGLGQIELMENVFVQMHGPVFLDLVHSIKEGKEDSIAKAGINSMIALFAMGTVSQDLNEAKRIAESIGIKHIVLHPYSADIAFKNGLVSLSDSAAMGISIEPDYKRPNDNPYIIHDPYEVIDIAHEHETAICMDLSHDVITHNSLDYLWWDYELYKNAPGGISNIHFSVAIPSPDGNFYTLDRGAEPLYADTPRDIATPYIEFVNGVLQDRDFKGNIIIEISSFPKGGTISSRVEAVKETLGSLFDSSKSATYSIPNK